MGHPAAAVWDSEVATAMLKDCNGIDQIVLRNPHGATAKVSLYGGQVISWKNNRGEELFFTSSKVNVKDPKAIRGGIPICFPQFGNCGSLEQHGYARNKIWTVDEDPPSLSAKDFNRKSFIDLLLKPSEEDLKLRPHSFELRLRVCLGVDGNLSLISRVRNTNGKPFSFSFAFHTYLSVSDISEVRIEGLETMDYFDNLCERERFTEQGDAITFEAEIKSGPASFDSFHLPPDPPSLQKLLNRYCYGSETEYGISIFQLALKVSIWVAENYFERVYLRSPNCVAVIDHEKRRTFVIRKEGLPDVVVWNPWEKKSKAMADMGYDEYRKMVCVDGAVIEKPITLKPGEEWMGRLEISLVHSSFCSEGLCF